MNDSPHITEHRKEEPSIGRRLLWFIALWCGGVLAIGMVGLIIKLIINTQFPNQ